MSDPNCVIYFGLRFSISPEEVQGLERRSDTRLVTARRAGLQSYWGRFADPNGHALFVGAPVGLMGPENQLSVEWHDDQYENLAVSVREKLKAAGFEQAPALHIAWQADE